MGPEIGKFWISSRALSDGFVPRVAAVRTFRPSVRLLTSPIRTWWAASGTKTPVTSVPFRNTSTSESAVAAGTLTPTRTSPPLTRSGPVESVVISSRECERPRSSAAAGADAPASTMVARMVESAAHNLMATSGRV